MQSAPTKLRHLANCGFFKFTSHTFVLHSPGANSTDCANHTNCASSTNFTIYLLRILPTSHPHCSPAAIYLMQLLSPVSTSLPSSLLTFGPFQQYFVSELWSRSGSATTPASVFAGKCPRARKQTALNNIPKLPTKSQQRKREPRRQRWEFQKSLQA